MAETSGFFDANYDEATEEFDRVYVAEEFAKYFASFVRNGVFNFSPVLSVEASRVPDMSVNLTKGKCWINGYWYDNDSLRELSIQASNPTRDRIDSVIVRWGRVERQVFSQIVTGEASISPTPPAPQRNGEYFDLVVAHIRVRANTSSILQSDIIDTRMNNEICGFVTSLIDQVDTTTLYKQFEAYQNGIMDEGDEFSNWLKEKRQEFKSWLDNEKIEISDWETNEKEEFVEWFDKIKGQLSEDAAGRLQIQINENRQMIDDIAEMVLTGLKSAPLELEDGSILTLEGGFVDGAMLAVQWQ